MEMTTPPADDLRARQVIADAIKLATGGSFNTPADVADWLRDELAALSALPASGEQPFRNMPDGTTFEQYRDALAVGGLTPVDQMAFDNLLDDLLTTPPADADVGTQGEDVVAGEVVDCNPRRGGQYMLSIRALVSKDVPVGTKLRLDTHAVKDDWKLMAADLMGCYLACCTSLGIRPYAPHVERFAALKELAEHESVAPAAGKGVDDDVREYLTEQLATEGAFEGLGYSKVERNLRALRKLDALTRQPVAGDGLRRCQWSQSDEHVEFFETGCGHSYIVNDGETEGMKFCLFCGDQIEVAPTGPAQGDGEVEGG